MAHSTGQKRKNSAFSCALEQAVGNSQLSGSFIFLVVLRCNFKSCCVCQHCCIVNSGAAVCFVRTCCRARIRFQFGQRGWKWARERGTRGEKWNDRKTKLNRKDIYHHHSFRLHNHHFFSLRPALAPVPLAVPKKALEMILLKAKGSMVALL